MGALFSLVLAVAPLLDFQAGTMLVHSPASLGSDTRFAPWSLNDGQPDTGWSSARESKPPFTFVYELDALSRLDLLKLDARQAQERQYPGCSAKDVELWVSSTSASEGFVKVAAVSLKPLELKGVKLPAGTKGRWVKLVVASNHGNAEYTQLMEASAYGDKQEPPEKTGALTGHWSTSLYESLKLSQDGDQLYGCYRYRNFVGTVRGAVWGRLARVTWQESRVDGAFPTHGTAAFQVSHDGGKLAGLWFTADGALGGTWDGLRAKQGVEVDCGQQVAAEAATEGPTALYGVTFVPGASALTPEAEASVARLAATARAQPGKTVSLEVHDDDAALAGNRAKSLKAALIVAGVPADQLNVSAAPRSEPVAVGKTAQARALNERVVLRGDPVAATECRKATDAGAGACRPQDAGH